MGETSPLLAQRVAPNGNSRLAITVGNLFLLVAVIHLDILADGRSDTGRCIDKLSCNQCGSRGLFLWGCCE
jgi:hypothetical protein